MITVGRRCGFAAALVCFLVTGCASHRHPTAPASEPFAGAPSDTAAIRLFVYCWNHRDARDYATLFTRDFQFVFALGDSAGQLFSGREIDQPEMLRIAHNMFVGGDAQPPMTNVNLQVDQILQFSGDPGAAHRRLTTNVNLHITANEPYDVYGQARFVLVRGDSAALPDTLLHLGIRPDSTRWFIQEWDDETANAPAGAHTAPVRNLTWGAVMSLYR